MFYAAHARKAMFALPQIVLDCVYIVALFAMLVAGGALLIWSPTAKREEVRIIQKKKTPSNALMIFSCGVLSRGIQNMPQ